RVPVRSGVLRAAASRRCVCVGSERHGGRAPHGRRSETRARGGADRGLPERAAAGAGAIRADRRPHEGAAVSLVLYDAARCPYCARVRIVLAEKDVEFEGVEIDLSDPPAWLYEK